MRVYPKGSRKSLPFIDYSTIQTPSSSWSFLTFFAAKDSFNYGYSFLNKSMALQDVPSCFYSKKCRVEHDKNILMMFVTEDLLVFDSLLIHNHLLNKRFHLSQENIIKYISKAAVRNFKDTKVIDMRVIKEDSPELKFICSLQQI